jgi:hypothetical protein
MNNESNLNRQQLEENFKKTFSLENLRNLLKQIINFGDEGINNLLTIINKSVTDKFQNMMDEDLLLISIKQKLDQTKIDRLNQLIQSLINIVDDFFKPQFFIGFFNGLKTEYNKLDFKDLNIFDMVVNGKIMVEFEKYSNIIGQFFQNMTDQIYNSLIQKALNNENNPIFKEIMDQIKLPDIFTNYLEKIFQDLITSLPIISINMLTSIIPNPFFINLLQLIENYGYKSIQTILFLLLNEAATVVNKMPTLPKSDDIQAAGKKRGKYKKQYYLNRINNTIKNFYKTNKTRFRKR